MKQLLYNMHFNLRKSKASKPTNINCVVYMNGKQYYFATGVKILPCQWDKKRQIAVISNVQSRRENLQVPKRSAIKECPSPRDADVLDA